MAHNTFLNIFNKSVEQNIYLEAPKNISILLRIIYDIVELYNSYAPSSVLKFPPDISEKIAFNGLSNFEILNKYGGFYASIDEAFSAVEQDKLNTRKKVLNFYNELYLSIKSTIPDSSDKATMIWNSILDKAVEFCNRCQYDGDPIEFRTGNQQLMCYCFIRCKIFEEVPNDNTL
jgi:hypothetical protein